MEKGQNGFSAVEVLLSGAGNLPLAAARDVGLLALGGHVALAPLGGFSVDALLGGSHEPYRV